MQPLFCICFSTQCPNWIDADLHWTGVCSSGMAGTSKLWVVGLPGVGAVRFNNCSQWGSGHQHDQHWADWTGTWCSIHSACHCTQWGGRKCEHHPGHQHMWVGCDLRTLTDIYQWMPLEFNIISSFKLIKKWENKRCTPTFGLPPDEFWKRVSCYRMCFISEIFYGTCNRTGQ